MGLFKRRSDSGSSFSEPEPIDRRINSFSQSDLDSANRLMTRFEDVRGNGSDQDLADVLEKFGELGDGRLSMGWNRPWVWWTEIAQEAHELGDHGLTGKIFLFSVDYMENIGPNLPNNFGLGVGYGMMDDAAYKGIASVGLDALNVMQADRPDIDFAPEIAKAREILGA